MVQVRILRGSRSGPSPWLPCRLHRGRVRRRGQWARLPARPSPPRGGSGQTVEVIAVGDIGWCGSRGTAETAQLVESLSGWLLLAGDIAYPNGSRERLSTLLRSGLGTISRTAGIAVPGNHDYLTPGASRLLRLLRRRRRQRPQRLLCAVARRLADPDARLQHPEPAQQRRSGSSSGARWTCSVVRARWRCGTTRSSPPGQNGPNPRHARPVRPARGGRRRRRDQRARSPLRALRQPDRGRAPRRTAGSAQFIAGHRRRGALPVRHDGTQLRSAHCAVRHPAARRCSPAPIDGSSS